MGGKETSGIWPPPSSVTVHFYAPSSQESSIGAKDGTEILAKILTSAKLAKDNNMLAYVCQFSKQFIT
eukprot:scaffold45707_cov56-Attheya_sp.AAC.1